VIDPITEYILEQTVLVNTTLLPNEIKISLERKIYPHYKLNTTVEKQNKSSYGWIEGKNLNIIRKLKLIGILNYGNGDAAWYSVVDGKVYDYSHDFDGFSSFLSSNDQRYIHPPMLYDKWEKSVLSGKHGSAMLG
jgi:hypothetical protein